jgi:hypothetical protein
VTAFHQNKDLKSAKHNGVHISPNSNKVVATSTPLEREQTKLSKKMGFSISLTLIIRYLKAVKVTHIALSQKVSWNVQETTLAILLDIVAYKVCLDSIML